MTFEQTELKQKFAQKCQIESYQIAAWLHALLCKCHSFCPLFDYYKNKTGKKKLVSNMNF